VEVNWHCEMRAFFDQLYVSRERKQTSVESRRLSELLTGTLVGVTTAETDNSWSADAGQLVNRRRGPEPTRDDALSYDAVVRSGVLPLWTTRGCTSRRQPCHVVADVKPSPGTTRPLSLTAPPLPSCVLPLPCAHVASYVCACFIFS